MKGFMIHPISGYYSLLYIYLLLMATIHATMLGASIIAKEERGKKAEFLFVKPVSRNGIITAKLLVAFTNIVIQSCYLCFVDYTGWEIQQQW
ncbi:MAG: ABC transporter permease subunit [Bacillus sp. (in: firmicutes)]